MLKKSLIDLATEKDLAAGNFPTVKTSEIIDTDKMPTSCEDLQRIWDNKSAEYFWSKDRKIWKRFTATLTLKVRTISYTISLYYSYFIAFIILTD